MAKRRRRLNNACSDDVRARRWLEGRTSWRGDGKDAEDVGKVEETSCVSVMVVSGRK